MDKEGFYKRCIKGKILKKGNLTIILAILLVLAVCYIFYDKYSEIQIQKQITVYQQGMQLGYQQALGQLLQQAATCQQVPVTLDDQTVNLIAVECLQAAGARTQ